MLLGIHQLRINPRASCCRRCPTRQPSGTVMMAKKIQTHPEQRIANKLFRFLTDHGRGANYRHVLSVRGRTAGMLRSTPVDVMQDGESPLAGRPYGEVNWVRNLRADDGKLTLRRGSHSQHYQQPLCAAVCANAHGRT